MDLVTSMPDRPRDGQRVLYIADAARSVIWPLTYRAGRAYPWEYTP